MFVMGVNGSPRKGWNTSTLVRDVLDGAETAGATTEMVALYNLAYSGCRSCFACKRVGLDDHRCHLRDGLSPVLERARAADALVLGSPVYFHQVTSGLAAFMERLLFPLTTYRADPVTFCQRPVPTAFVYTMNVGEDLVESMRPAFGRYETLAGKNLRCEPESYCAFNTWQYRDYDLYEHSVFDVESKRLQRENQFPKDRQACREMGARLVARVEALDVGSPSQRCPALVSFLPSYLKQAVLNPRIFPTTMSVRFWIIPLTYHPSR